VVASGGVAVSTGGGVIRRQRTAKGTIFAHETVLSLVKLVTLNDTERHNGGYFSLFYRLWSQITPE